MAIPNTEQKIINIVLSKCTFDEYPNVWQLVAYVIVDLNYDGHASIDEIAYHVLSIRDKILIAKEKELRHQVYSNQ
jgi:hypothetical protein